MRITTNMMMNNYLSDLNGNLNRLSKYVEQETTGKSINNISDDPVGVTKSLLARNRLSGTERYQDNVKTAKNWLTEVDSSLGELNKVLQSAYENAVEASTGTMSDDDRRAMAEEVAQLRDEALSTANATMGDSYLFAGYSTTGVSGGKPPFNVDAAGDIYYNGINMSNEASADYISEAAGSASKSLDSAQSADAAAQAAAKSSRNEILPSITKAIGSVREVSSAAGKAAKNAADISASAGLQGTTMGKLLSQLSDAASAAGKAASDAAGAAFSAADAMQAAADKENDAYTAWQNAIGTDGETAAHDAYSAAQSAADAATDAARSASADAVSKAKDASEASDGINTVTGAFNAFAGASSSLSETASSAQKAYDAGNYGGVADAASSAAGLAASAVKAGQAFAGASSVIGAPGASDIADAVSALQTAASNASAAAAGVTDSTSAQAAQDAINDVMTAIGALQNTVKNNVSGSDAMLNSSNALNSESDDALKIQVGSGYPMEISEPGTELFGRGSENVYCILDEFHKALTSGADKSELGGFIDRLQDAQSRVLSLDAKVGAKVDRLNTLSSRYEANVSNYTQMQSDAEDVDMAQAIMNYSSAKTVYDAALASGSQIIQTSLIDFLK